MAKGLRNKEIRDNVIFSKVFQIVWLVLCNLNSETIYVQLIFENVKKLFKRWEHGCHIMQRVAIRTIWGSHNAKTCFSRWRLIELPYSTHLTKYILPNSIRLFDSSSLVNCFGLISNKEKKKLFWEFYVLLK